MLLSLFDDMTQCSAAEIERLQCVVSLQRRIYAEKYRFESDQFCCLKAFEMLHQLVEKLAEKTLEAEELIFDYTDNGRPFLKMLPNIHFSISHCKRAIVVVVDRQPIGCDVEAIAPIDDALVARVMNESERKQIQNAANSALEFTRLWTQKEATLKCKGTGIVDIDTLPQVLNNAKQLTTHENVEKGYVYSISSYRE